MGPAPPPRANTLSNAERLRGGPRPTLRGSPPRTLNASFRRTHRRRSVRTAFRDLNASWIEEHWQLEPKDLESLDNPQRSILGKGGAILIAEDDREAIGCVALIPCGDGVLELAKMSVAAEHRGRRVGRMLIDHAIAYARSVGASKLFLESNTQLEPAIRLYEKSGFRRVPPSAVKPSPYARCDIAMEMDL